MSVNLMHELALRDASGQLQVVVETPAQTRVKLKYDDAAGVFAWSRPLPLGVAFPYDFGFFPMTLAGDGDALDALVLADLPSWPGVVVAVRAVGALRVEQQRDGGPLKRNDRVLAVPVNAHRQADLRDIDEVPDRVRQEIESFYHASLALTGKHVRLAGWADAAEALHLVESAHLAYTQSRE